MCSFDFSYCQYKKKKKFIFFQKLLLQYAGESIKIWKFQYYSFYEVVLWGMADSFHKFGIIKFCENATPLMPLNFYTFASCQTDSTMVYLNPNGISSQLTGESWSHNSIPMVFQAN